MDHKLKIEIAEIVFLISCLDKKTLLWIEKNYKPFLSSKKPDFHALLKLNKNRKRKRGKPSSRWINERFYAETRSFDIVMDFENRDAVVLANNDFGIVDLIKFMYSTVLTKRNGFFLHASAVIDREFSYVFFGPSGSGKTTIAELSKDKIILTDETTAIVKKNGIYYAYSTPFFGEFGQIGQNIGAPIKAVFSIKKGKRFAHSLIEPVCTAREIICNTFINTTDTVTVNSVLNTLDSLVRGLPCYELHFKKEPKIWEYINGSIK